MMEDSSATWEHEQLAKVKILVLRGHTDSVQSCQFCIDDSKILTASNDLSIRLWDAQTGKLVQKFQQGHSHFISKAVSNRDGTRFASVGWDKTVVFWDMEKGTILWRGAHKGIITCCNFSHDGQLLVTCSDLDFTVRVWNCQDGALVKEIKDLHDSTVTSCCFSPNDDKIFTTSMDMTTKVWDLKTDKNTITLGGHHSVVSSCSCSADERRFATVSWDKSIRVSDISTGNYRLQGCASIEKAHDGSISSCDFSHDGCLLVTGGYDRQVLIWDVNNMVLKLKLQGHADWVNDVCFSNDQRRIVSCSKDCTVRVWHIENAEKIPMVIESKSTVGVQLMTCIACGSTFSPPRSELCLDKPNLCVFCRMEISDKKKAII